MWILRLLSARHTYYLKSASCAIVQSKLCNQKVHGPKIYFETKVGHRYRADVLFQAARP